MVLKKIKKGLVFFRYLGKHKQQYWPWTVGHRQQILVGRYIFLSQSILRKPKKVSNIWSEEGLEPSKYFWNKYDIHFNDNQMLRPNARVLSMEVKVTWICGLVSLHLVTGRGLLPQDAQGFSAWWAKVILHMWTCWRHVSLKTVVFDWWSHVPLIIHALFVVVVPDPTCKAHILPSSPPGQHDIFVRTESPTLIAVHHGTPGASTLFLSTGFSELFHFFSSIWFHSFNNVDTFLSFMSDTQTTSKIRHAVLKSKNKKTMLRMPYN